MSAIRLSRYSRGALRAIDRVFTAWPPRRNDESALVCLLFHAVRRTPRDVLALAPDQSVTVDELKRFLDIALEDGFRPVGPAQVAAGLAAGRKHLLVTFDDGYFNNALALDVLAQFQAPALFFVSSAHVLEQKAFWWDALARHMRAQGASERALRAELARARFAGPHAAEARLLAQFGEAALRPGGDADRPFSASELRDFARSRWVHVGNHTRHHVVLPNCEVEEMYAEIQGCQRDLRAITGRTPIAIAYPNGSHSRDAVAAARAAGLRLGFTVRPVTHRDPARLGDCALALGRYIVSGGEDPAFQWRKMRAGFVPSYAIKSLLAAAW